ncbi:MAG TPA: PDZ domain-containing protein [Porticoccaceae bacterium]|jgi:hypothetical protein|nr:PDZ domain-containing protein [Gammaproteobacteria bacterium]HIL60679.1 PDZ domain-containing protein [Porticoccaceae bacterium]
MANIVLIYCGFDVADQTKENVMRKFNHKASVKCCLIVTLSMSMIACINYEPAVLIPAITLSAEDISLRSDQPGSGVDFGLDVSLNESDSLANVEILPGIRVRSVSNNSVADSAGIRVGDIILSIDGIASNNPDILLAAQENTDADTELKFRVRRNTTVFETGLTGRLRGGNSAPIELFRIDPLASRAAYQTQLINIAGRSGMAAARIVEIYPKSPLLVAEIGIDDIVVALNEVEVNSAQGLVNDLNQNKALGESVIFSIFDGETISNKTVKLWDPGRRISRLSLGPVLQYNSSLSPKRSNLNILDFWLFSLYEYNQIEEEKSHSLFGIFNFISDYGELTEEQN